ncbi:hypothetical protein CN557_08105 [Bacillus wiedmannii]|uniref:hypothetical protein n=1 Tax=Bacillus wiedmannii TaxID=1890302 RepID=UPI000BF3EEC2|nr:hypothetical protein [Bacillus wiedmannii]PEP54020.1 hypothetical protein CN557_08105 [Bacillus wiedmannii]
MIKIELNNTILEKHLKYCEFKKKGRRTSLTKKLNKEINDCTNDKIKDLLEFLKLNLKTLAIGNPIELNNFKEIVCLKIDSAVQEEQHVENLKEKIEKILIRIFHTEYNRFVNETNPQLWGAYAFVEALNISVCPYCNSQFIFTLRKKGGKTRPVLDHYFCKSKYPFLAISIYNLIPCCKVCNSDFKGDTEVFLDTQINPYLDSFHEFVKFKRKVTLETSIDYFSTMIGETNDFEIILDFNNVPEDTRHKYENHAELFHIKDIYQFHKKHVKELIIKSRIYNDIYRKQLKTSYTKLFSSDEDLKQILVPKDDEINNIILSKLTKDIILNELPNNIRIKS